MEEERSVDSEVEDEIQNKKTKIGETVEPEKGGVDLVNNRSESKIKRQTWNSLF